MGSRDPPPTKRTSPWKKSGESTGLLTNWLCVSGRTVLWPRLGHGRGGKYSKCSYCVCPSSSEQGGEDQQECPPPLQPPRHGEHQATPTLPRPSDRGRGGGHEGDQESAAVQQDSPAGQPGRADRQRDSQPDRRCWPLAAQAGGPVTTSSPATSLLLTSSFSCLLHSPTSSTGGVTPGVRVRPGGGESPHAGDHEEGGGGPRHWPGQHLNTPPFPPLRLVDVQLTINWSAPFYWVSLELSVLLSGGCHYSPAAPLFP